MAPNLDDNILNRPTSDLILFMRPLLPNGPISDDESDDEITSLHDEEEQVDGDPSQIFVPLEQNLHALLVINVVVVGKIGMILLTTERFYQSKYLRRNFAASK